MTGPQLRELMERVVAVAPTAWPEHYEYSRGGFRNSLSRGGTHPDNIVPLFRDSLSAWLDEHVNHWVSSRNNAGFTIYSACMGSNGRRLGEGKTKLEALAEAVIQEAARMRGKT